MKASWAASWIEEVSEDQKHHGRTTHTATTWATAQSAGLAFSYVGLSYLIYPNSGSFADSLM